MTARKDLGDALRRCRGAFVGVGAFSLVVNLLMLTGPLFMLQVYDRVLTSRSVSTLIALTGLVAALYGFMGLLEFIRTRVLSRVGNQIDSDLNARAFGIWIGDAGARQDACSQPLHDLQSLRQFLTGPGPLTLFDMPWVPIYLGIIFLFHWTLGLVATIGAVVILIIALINELRTCKPTAAANLAERRSMGFALLSRRNAEAVLAMGMRPHVLKHWQSLQAEAVSNQNRVNDRSGGTSVVSKSIRRFLQSAILAAGAALAIQQLISPGAMIAASIIMGRALAPIDQAIGQWKGFVGARQAWHRLAALFDKVPASVQRTRLPAPAGRLAVDNLFVLPPEGGKAILEALSFQLEPGQGLGVIGPSAAGKTTLARLLTGLWQPTRGAIRLDGAALDQWDHDTLGRHLGYLPQGVELFDGTVKSNIARFIPDATDEAVVEAAIRAGAHEMILGLADGYDTQIGEAGTVLSGGQRQRIGLARALFGDPALVVLDEPNANLDAEGDAALTAAIEGLRKRGKTVVVMAHRPSAIAAVDMLLMLRDGRQQTFGPKDEVLRQVTQIAPTTSPSTEEQRLAG